MYDFQISVSRSIEPQTYPERNFSDVLNCRWNEVLFVDTTEVLFNL